MSSSTYFVSGASRGLGVALVRQILEKYPGSKVIAAARKPQESSDLQKLHQSFPNRLTLVTLDVDSDASVKAAAEYISTVHSEGIDYVINNAATAGNKQSTPEELLRTFNTNVVGVLRVTNALLPLIRKGRKKVVANISSNAGSNAMQGFVRDFFAGGNDSENTYHGYRVSKAALNSLTVVFAKDHEKEGIIFVAIHPGAVLTDMYTGVGGKLQGSPDEATPDESAIGQLSVIHKLTIEDSGKYLTWKGDSLPF